MCVEVPIINDNATELAEMFMAVLDTDEERVFFQPDENLGVDLLVNLTTEDIPGQAISESAR